MRRAPPSPLGRVLHIVSIAPSGPSARALTRPCGPPLPLGSRPDRLPEARAGACPIPSWEGWPQAGVGCLRPGPVEEPTPPLRGTPPRRGCASALLTSSCFYSGFSRDRPRQLVEATPVRPRVRCGKCIPGNRGLVRWCPVSGLLWWCAKLRPPAGRDKSGCRPWAGRGRARCRGRQQSPLRLAQATPDAPCPGEKTSQPEHDPPKIQQKMPPPNHLIRDNRGELVYGTSCWLALPPISSANADRGRP